MRPDGLVAKVPVGDARTRYVLETVLRDGVGLPLTFEEHPRSDVSLVLGSDPESMVLAAVDQPSSAVATLLKYKPEEVEAFDLAGLSIEDFRTFPLLSALFHVLVGSEEVEDGRRDSHDRFAASTSRLVAAGYDCAPFVDLWGEVLARFISVRWPSVERKSKPAGLAVSHDVDAPFRFRFLSPLGLLRGMAGNVLRGQWRQAIVAPWQWAQVKSGRTDCDPFNQFGWMMDQAEAVGARCTFYVIAGHTAGRVDGDYDIYHPVMMRLWEQILTRGHRIGVHPSYNSFRSLAVLQRERQRIVDLCKKLEVPCDSPPVRMHYLRFDPMITPGLLAAAGFKQDSSLGFADRSGFRRGTCRPFRLWDHVTQRALDLVEHPLLAMDATLIAKRYEQLGEAEVGRRIAKLAHWCERFGGELTLLWHNNFYEEDWHFRAYRSALSLLSAAGPMDSGGVVK